MHIMGMVFDLSTRTLFWSDNGKEIIVKMHVPLDGKPSNPVILHNFTSDRPSSIALDVCNRCVIYDYLYFMEISFLIAFVQSKNAKLKALKSW